MGLGALLASGQQAPVSPTLDREVEGKARQALQPAPKVQAPGGAAAEPADAADDLKLDFLYGVGVLTNRAQVKLEGGPRGKPLQVPESDPLLNSDAFKELILSYCQKPMSTRRMTQLLHDIIRFYHTHGHMLVDVLYEPQDISNGMLQVTVLEGKLKQIRIQ